MTFKAKPDNKKKFGRRETRVLSVRVPSDEYEAIKRVINKYVDNYSEKNWNTKED